MMKYALLAGAMMIAGPALAQTTSTAGQSAPTQTAAPATQTTAPTNAAPATTAQTPVPTSTTTSPAPATASPAGTTATTTAQQPAQTTGQPAQTASTQPAAAGATQVAQVVEQEFPTYDANKDGNLSSTEFGAWMVALKKASDPNVNATAPETVKWNQAAFAQADTDKNASVSKAELTTFLSKAAG